MRINLWLSFVIPVSQCVVVFFKVGSIAPVPIPIFLGLVFHFFPPRVSEQSLLLFFQFSFPDLHLHATFDTVSALKLARAAERTWKIGLEFVLVRSGEIIFF